MHPPGRPCLQADEPRAKSTEWKLDDYYRSAYGGLGPVTTSGSAADDPTRDPAIRHQCRNALFLGKVFFPSNVWPSSCQMLKPAMLEAYIAFEKLSEALLLPLGGDFRPW